MCGNLDKAARHSCLLLPRMVTEAASKVRKLVSCFFRYLTVEMGGKPYGLYIGGRQGEQETAHRSLRPTLHSRAIAGSGRR
jgi:hypothetical protein